MLGEYTSLINVILVSLNIIAKHVQYSKIYTILILAFRDDWQRNCKGKNVSEWTSGCKFDFHGSG